MERSEPALVPQWLRSTGNVTGGSSALQHSSCSHSDGISPANSWRSSTSNGSAKHAYSSFSRSHRDKDRDRDKERSSFGDYWDHDCSDPLGDIFAGRVNKDKLRRSNSTVLKKPCDLLNQRVDGEPKLGNQNLYNGNGLLSGGGIGNRIHKVEFEKDFPSLGIDEGHGVPDMGRVLSPGLRTGVQSLLFGSSALVGGEGWRSALVEVPSSSAQQFAVSASGPGAPNAVSGLNMAETLAQVPLRADCAPQLSVKTQRLEELAIKQSRQLIPMTPLLSKASVLSSDKSKLKTAVRIGEMIAAPKIGQQQPSSSNLANQYHLAVNVKSDTAKSSHGKFLILKPIWENGISPAAKEVASPTSSVSSQRTNTQVSPAPNLTSTPLRSSDDLKSSTMNSKGPNTVCKVEKRPSQAQSRKEFLNLMRKKSSTNAVTSISDSGGPILSPGTEKCAEAITEVSSTQNLDAIQNVGEMIRDDTTCKRDESFSVGGERDLSRKAAVYPEEEEAAFLRSLGWDENGGEEGGLTEEEINGFLQEYMRLRPSLKLCGSVLQRISMLPDSHASTLSGASLGLSSSNSGSHA